MPANSKKYIEYFNVNESYFPCIDESAINAGAKWENTYPHESFIALLNNVEKMLGGTTNRSIWIHGAYGTGKSQCAYALKKILEVSNDELQNYWDKYEQLKNNKILLQKLIGHKDRGIVTAYRYASGTISTPEQLFLAVQESVRNALDANNIPYKGANTLKESTIEWLSDPAFNQLVNTLLERPEWMSTFSQSTADEIINSLRKSSDVSELMDNIFKLAAKAGITALSLTADSLRNWIKDIIETNKITIVFIWDEFSDFFRQNKNSLGEFQKIVSICQEAPFYFIVVTHPITSLTSTDESWKVVQQRFDKTEITLPDNIAFDLIGTAYKTKESAKGSWNDITDDLDSRVSSSKNAVMKAANITKAKVMTDILPLHPMAALTLKHIASAFQSNQRSMFDFMKTPKDMDVQAFQWFIQNTSPYDERPLLTVDMLWNFFYEKGKDYLSSDIRLILDTYPQQTNLMEKEKIVLKTILILQAIDQRLGGTLPILKPTDQTLAYAFEGDEEIYNERKMLINSLKEKGIIINTPGPKGEMMYAAAVLAGDSAKIDAYMKDIRKNATIQKLVEEGDNLGTSLNLTPALKLRYSMDLETGRLPIVTYTDFVKKMDSLKNKDVNWHFYAVLALAKTEDEAQTFRKLIKKTIEDESYKNILVIDALSTPLGLESFEEYVKYSAYAMYYQGNKNQQSKDNNKKAKDVLNQDWKNRIHDGQFIVWSYKNQSGEKATGANAVQTILQTAVLSRYRYISDFTKGLTESQLKLTPGTNKIARHGMGDTKINGIISGCEKTVLGKVWNIPNYWTIPELENDPIVIIKKAVDKLIKESFDTSGKVSIDEICEFLTSIYGFSPCNVSAFIIGFLLKEYNSDPYRFQDYEGHRDSMTPDKLAEMIGNCMNKKAKPTYIVNLTEEEKAFYEITEKAWGLNADECTSPQQASSHVNNQMRKLSYPVWCLEDIDDSGVYDFVKKYIELVQNTGDKAHDIANSIGKMYIARQSAAEALNQLLTKDNCQKGMEAFIKKFEGGKLWTLAQEIKAEQIVLSDITNLFSVKYSALWINSTGESELENLITRYEVIKATNALLNVSANTIINAFREWKNTLSFVGFSCESAQSKYKELKQLFDCLLKIANSEDILPDAMSQLLSELQTHNKEISDIINNCSTVFSEIYAPYLEGLSEAECEKVRSLASSNNKMFTLSSTQSNMVVKNTANEYRKNQIRNQLTSLWAEKAPGTKNPREWSEKNSTPILCCIDENLFSSAQRAFSALNNKTASESDINFAILFLKDNETIFSNIADSDFRDKKFMEKIVAPYQILLPDINTIRSKLKSLDVDVYDWAIDPTVRNKIRDMANAEYNAGGSDKAIDIIDSMSDAELKSRLKELTKHDSELGIKILISGRK